MAYIYKIINLVNKKIYIGETIRTIDIRWKQHIYKSKNGANGHLYAAMRLYGIDNFTVEEIERCSTEDRFERETYYISKFNSLEPNGYNWILAQHGENSSLIELLFNEWEEGSSLINIGEKFHIDPKRVGYLLKGCGVSQEEIYARRAQSVGKRSSKAVLQYTMDGIFVKEFASASAAAKELGLNHSSISKSANGDILTYNGYIWQYKNDDNIENVMLQLKKVSKTGKNKKRVSQYSLNNEFIQSFESASAAGRYFNKSHSGIAYAARNGTVALGFKWKYEEEKRDDE